MNVDINNIVRTTTYQTTIHTEQGTFAFDTLIDRNYEDSVRIVVEGDKAAVGYLWHDSDVEWEGWLDDGMGRIIQRENDRGDGEFQEALGLDGNWEPDLSDFEERAETEVLMTAIRELNEQHGGGLVFAIEWGGTDWDTHEETYNVASQYPDKAETLTARTWSDWGEDHMLHEYVQFLGHQKELGDQEQVALELWRKARESGKVGNPYAVLLDVYEHSGISFHLRGQGIYDPWDTSYGGALWLPSKMLVEDIESNEDPKKRARQLAGECAKEYTRWCNGETYGFSVITFTREGDEWMESGEDCCGGFIGYDYAIKSLEEAMRENIV